MCSYLIFRDKGKKKRAATVKVEKGQLHDLAVWCRDHAQSIFKLMDPEHNTKTKVDDDWDATYEYAKELGMAFPDLKSFKKRMRRWRLVLKGLRDDSHDTGTQCAFLQDLFHFLRFSTVFSHFTELLKNILASVDLQLCKFRK